MAASQAVSLSSWVRLFPEPQPLLWSYFLTVFRLTPNFSAISLWMYPSFRIFTIISRLRFSKIPNFIPPKLTPERGTEITPKMNEDYLYIACGAPESDHETDAKCPL
jgi:hypothetical protein